MKREKLSVKRWIFCAAEVAGELFRNMSEELPVEGACPRLGCRPEELAAERASALLGC